MPPSDRPAPFSAYTTPEFWNDPHISAKMLAHHLAPDSPGASRPHPVVEASSTWIGEAFDVGPATRVLDLGCGPGLYATRLAERGAALLGIDVSTRSLAHARALAGARGLDATYREGNYLTVDLDRGHDLALLIYEDYCALSPSQRGVLLRRVHEALAPGGHLVLDVSAAPRFDSATDGVVAGDDLDDGFWAPSPYHGVHETWTYPELRLVLDRYTITTERGTRRFWNWIHCLTADEVARELRDAGFDAPSLHGDLAGGRFDPTATGFAVSARRPDDR